MADMHAEHVIDEVEITPEMGSPGAPEIKADREIPAAIKFLRRRYSDADLAAALTAILGVSAPTERRPRKR
jgi:hypothetical protein